jgi:subtilisin-like proprotein convertase family protein
MMKKQLGILMLMLVALASRADSTNATFSATLSGGGAAIPDANPVGLTSTLNVSGMSGSTTNITVNLNITGGFSGDLYAYLLSPQGSMVVLLNRVGVSSTSNLGYSDAGFSITLDSASANNVHNYQSDSPSIIAGQLTGTWAPDGRTIDPIYSAPSAFNAAATGNTLGVYDSSSPNGVWTLFVADLSGGGQSTLVSWGLTVVTVPEPQTWTILGGGLAACWLLIRRRK